MLESSVEVTFHNKLVGLVGSPNSGKTTLFNWLTGSRFKTVNYPGSTIDCYRGWTLPVYGATPLQIVDTPGIYSLNPQSDDEEVTLGTLRGGLTRSAPSLVIAVVDATQMARQLYIVRQLQEAGLNVVIALTMIDLIRLQKQEIDIDKLSELVGAPVVPIDGRLGGGVKTLVDLVRSRLESATPVELKDVLWDKPRVDQEMKRVGQWAHSVFSGEKAPNTSSRPYQMWDRILLHPVWGLLAFALIMFGLFSSIFWLATPLMDLVDAGFAGLGTLATELFGNGAFGNLIGSGIIGGVGAVMVFVPQIFILFLGMNLLEDSGYLARAATLVDRPFQAIGLSGRSFVPVLSGFACAVPAIMATRNLRTKRERLIATLILPFMTCSARLPVYALLLSFLFWKEPAWKPGLSLAGLYIGSLFIGAIAAAILNRMIKKEQHDGFMMELPYYRRPKLKVVLRSSLLKTKSYLRKAGPTILTFVVILWIGSHFPYNSHWSETQQLQNSVVGYLGRWIEPIFYPMGLDWRVGVALISAFVAREVFVSSLAVVFSITAGAAGLQNSLIGMMKQATYRGGHPLFSPASVCALILFFMIALQCLSTTSVVWRELKSLKIAVVQLVAYNVLAYILAVAVFQVLS